MSSISLFINRYIRQIQEEDAATIQPDGKAKKGSSKNAADLHEHFRGLYKTANDNRNYKYTTNCGSCLNSCFEFIKSIVDKPKKKNGKK